MSSERESVRRVLEAVELCAWHGLRPEAAGSGARGGGSGPVSRARDASARGTKASSRSSSSSSSSGARSPQHGGGVPFPFALPSLISSSSSADGSLDADADADADADSDSRTAGAMSDDELQWQKAERLTPAYQKRHFWDVVQCLETVTGPAYAPAVMFVRTNAVCRSGRGLCRAWLRHLLGQSALEINLKALVASSAISRWYEPWALLRSSQQQEHDGLLEAPLALMFVLLQQLERLGFSLDITDASELDAPAPASSSVIPPLIPSKYVSRAAPIEAHRVNLDESGASASSLRHNPDLLLEPDFVPSLLVYGAGDASANGRYVSDGVLLCDGVPVFRQPVTGYSVFRRSVPGSSAHGPSRSWLLGEADSCLAPDSQPLRNVLYRAFASSVLPPCDGWVVVTDGQRDADSRIAAAPGGPRASGAPAAQQVHTWNEIAPAPVLHFLAHGGSALEVCQLDPDFALFERAAVVQDEIRALYVEVSRVVHERALVGELLEIEPASKKSTGVAVAAAATKW